MQPKETVKLSVSLILSITALSSTLAAEDSVDWTTFFKDKLMSGEGGDPIESWAHNGLVVPKEKQLFYASVMGIDDDVLGSFLPIDDTVPQIRNFITCSGTEIWIDPENAKGPTEDKCDGGGGTWDHNIILAGASRVFDSDYQLIGYVSDQSSNQVISEIRAQGQASIVAVDASLEPNWSSAEIEKFVVAYSTADNKLLAKPTEKSYLFDAENPTRPEFWSAENSNVNSAFEGATSDFLVLENSNGVADILLLPTTKLPS